mmetsp:Transcript_51730/g.70530  ORF Transcript_51730/g.70530 Transcript_51730/m.70530 type:complete len:485 (+) Transcript_51730:720-2174(+)
MAEKMLLGDENQLQSWRSIGPPPINEYVNVFEQFLAAGVSLDDTSLATVGHYVSSSPEEARKSFSFGGDPCRKIALSRTLIGQPVTQPSPPPTTTRLEAKPNQRTHSTPQCDDVTTEFRQRTAALFRNNQFTATLLSDVTANMTEGDAMSLMTDEQLQSECTALMLPGTEQCRERSDWIALLSQADSTQSALTGPAPTSGKKSRHAKGKSKTKQPVTSSRAFEAANTDDVNDRTFLTASAHLGPAVIPVRIEGIAVYAFLSTTSNVTVMPEAFADKIGVPSTELRAGVSVGAAVGQGTHKTALKSVRLLSEFTLSFGQQQTSVIIRSGIASSRFTRVQLGLDFFASALRCQVDVVQDKKFMALVRPSLGFGHFRSLSLKKMHARAEQLRFYSRDGQTAVLPLGHCPDRIKDCTVTVGSSGDGGDDGDDGPVVNHCDWCGRFFPGLHACALCKNEGRQGDSCAYYCGRSCQKSGWSTHKLTHKKK